MRTTRQERHKELMEQHEREMVAALGYGQFTSERPRYAIENVDWSDPLSYVREMYGVPAVVGRRVTVNGLDGTIVGGDGQYIVVEIDGQLPAGNYHPTWHVDYHEEVNPDA